jgi:hypothetical protein
MSREPRQASVAPVAEPVRAEIELDEHTLHVRRLDGAARSIELAGARVEVRDGACRHRFVRHAVVRAPSGRLDLITPPEDGAIAPRAARVPGVPRAALIVASPVWDTASSWIGSGGGLRGRTIGELARLACVATSQFAIALGERIAQAAAELTWEGLGPMRGVGGELAGVLRPLEEAAAISPRAHEALLAALARGLTLRPYAFVR